MQLLSQVLGDRCKVMGW